MFSAMGCTGGLGPPTSVLPSPQQLGCMARAAGAVLSSEGVLLYFWPPNCCHCPASLRGSHGSVQITAIPRKSPCLPLPAESKGSQVMRGTNSAFLIEIACAFLACSSTDTLLKPLSVAHLCVGMQGQASRVLLRCRDQSGKQSIGATGNQRLEGGRSIVNIVIYFISKMNVAGG